MTQVSRDHYEFERYATEERFASYWYQLKEILEVGPISVLEIGVGDGVVGAYIRQSGGIAYTCADYAADTKPDVVADVRSLPMADGSFDVVCAYEVLEHLPFDDFEKAVSELVRVARHRIIISVPHFGPPVKFLLKIPFLPELCFAFKIPFPRIHTFNGQHYWEIGKRGYPVSRIRAVLSRYATLLRDYVPFENQYHHFFVLEKRQALHN